MTIEAYINSVLEKNPEFVQNMNDRVRDEYASQIAETKALFTSRLESAREKWCANRGEDAYEANKDYIADSIANDIPRYIYVKHISLSDDIFEVEVDLLEGAWSITPVGGSFDEEE